jgi:TatD DNase family protein
METACEQAQAAFRPCQHNPAGDIAHAFNGSFQQSQGYIDLGFKLGFGGAMTFTRAANPPPAAGLPLEAIVPETDAPDISTSWKF